MSNAKNMSIWKANLTIEKLNKLLKNNMCDHLGMKITELGDDYIVGTMPVDKRTHQPFGLLHGGASAAFSETLGSIAANMCLKDDESYCVGLEINATHIRSVKSGIVTGIARPIHIGNSIQVWETKIKNSVGKIVCISRLTVSVLKSRQ